MKKDDKELQRDILDELQWEPSVDAAEVGITVHNGVVTLTGSVPTYSEKLSAERVAKRMNGVRAVANDIEVRPRGTGERTDADIAQAALDALKWKSHVAADRVKVAVSKGFITLEGDVDWHYQKEAAEEAVRHLLGVRGVFNLLTVKPKVSASDLKNRIESAFKRSAELDAKKVSVETHDGKVTLRGDVHSWSERQEAERTAWAAPGVSQVENMITITPWSS